MMGDGGLPDLIGEPSGNAVARLANCSRRNLSWRTTNTSLSL
jgi:hypothetical protein